MSSKSTPRVILITGSSSGFGKLLVEVALANGDNVVATLRKPEVLKELQDQTPADRLLVLKLDVTKREDIINAFAKAKEKFGRVDAVYNNAGYAMNSAIETTPDDAARAIFETNFWGAVHVSQEAVRFFREENPSGAGGRLVVVNSLAGLIGIPVVGFYSASKFALEGITHALAGEIDPNWNIKITIVEPGNFRTRGSNPAETTLIPFPESYSAPTTGLSQVMAKITAHAGPGVKTGDARKGIQKMYDLLSLENPPIRLFLGAEAHLAMVRAHLDSIIADLEAYQSWSADLLED
ncbi:NAD-P-binding protein [Irpex rosettiformis]|uniref:NAD-P-binding protein n=1 Tax=Irpex rosettiformis TaxID=378272 RepID=A0ACB8TWW3_9APHY|nr:NAD-P-binding protein [Irpex rosettiformis]